jgi:adenylate cyclase
MLRYAFLLFFTLTFINSYAINKDSLVKLAFNKNADNKERFEAFIELSEYYGDNNPDSGLYFSKQMDEFGKSIKSKKIQTRALFSFGYCYFTLNQFRTSISYYEKAKVGYSELKKISDVAHCYSNLGLNYSALGDLSYSVKNYLKALEYYRLDKDTMMVGQTLNQVANLLDEQGRAMESLDYYYQSLNVFEELKHDYGQSVVLLNIATMYNQLKDTEKAKKMFQQTLVLKRKIGDVYGEGIVLASLAQINIEDKKLDSARLKLNSAAQIFQSEGKIEKLSQTYSSLANLYIEKENFDSANTYYLKSIALQRKLELKTSLPRSLAKLGDLRILQKRFAAALSFCNEGLSISNATGSLDGKRANCECLSKAYEGLKQSDKAFSFFKEAILLKDSLINGENIKAAAQKEMNFNFEKQKLETKNKFEKAQAEERLKTEAEKRQKNIITISGVIGLALLIVIISVIYIYLRRSKADNIIISRERRRSETLLLNILPEEIAQELKEKGVAEAKLHEHVTILFTDFKGFTQLSEKLTPVQLIDELNHCFVSFDRIMEKYGLEKIKTIGDAYMAASGLPIADDLHAVKMVRAALEIRDFMADYKAEREQQNAPYFELRLGINSGEVVAGIVGIKKFAYDIWGDTVNIAARMESSGEVGKVNISENTYNLVKEVFQCEARGSLEAKGKGKMNMYFVHGSL